MKTQPVERRIHSLPVRLSREDLELIHQAADNTVEWAQRVVDEALAAERARLQS